MKLFFFKPQFLCQAREPRRNPSNRRLNEHGIYIRHCQDSNSQPVPSQVQGEPIRPQCRPPTRPQNSILESPV